MHPIHLHHAVIAERDRTLRDAERLGPLLDARRTPRRRRAQTRRTDAAAANRPGHRTDRSVRPAVTP
jgi:hypothetical protein